MQEMTAAQYDAILAEPAPCAPDWRALRPSIDPSRAIQSIVGWVMLMFGFIVVLPSKLWETATSFASFQSMFPGEWPLGLAIMAAGLLGLLTLDRSRNIRIIAMTIMLGGLVNMVVLFVASGVINPGITTYSVLACFLFRAMRRA
jgi:hypothetical protein